MSNSNIPVLKFLFRDGFKSLNDALNIQPGYEVEEFTSPNDLATYLSTTSASLVVASLRNRDDLIQIATFMKVVKKVAKDAAVKVVVVNFSGDRNFEKAVGKIGIQDIVEPAINTKAFKFKIDFWMKSLNVQLKNAPGKDGAKVLKNSDPSKSNEKTKTDVGGLQFTEPLDLENDIWLLKHENDAKKVLSKWLIRLMGPSPYVAQWTEVKPGIWRFDMKENERDMYLSGEGAWFYAGDQKPEFVWKENTWLITGEAFDLFFKDSNQIQSRLKAKSKSLSICKNSLFAKTKEQLIIESFDKELVFKREAENLEDLEGKNKTDNLGSGSLEGKNKTDDLGSANLRGKNKTDQLDDGTIDGNLGTDHFGGPLSGKTKNKADRSGDMSGEIEPGERIKHQNLEQETKTGKEKTNWGNKNTYQEDEAKPDFNLSNDDYRQGAQLEQERKDQEHQKYYKNHNEAEKYEGLEKDQDRPLGGKSNTDHLAKNYGGKEDKERREKDGPERERAQGDSRNGDLAGKSETDKLKSHYGQKERTETAQHERQARELDGKSSTDKLGSHYSNPKKESQKAGHDDSDDSAVESPVAEKLRKDKEARAAKEKAEREREAKLPPVERERLRKERAEKGEPLAEETFDDLSGEKPSKDTREKTEGPTAKTKTGMDFVDPVSKARTRLESALPNDRDYDFKNDKKAGKKPAETNGDDDLAEVVFLKKPKDTPVKAKEIEEEKTQEEKELEELTSDAKIKSIIVQSGNKIECNLDDFFDDTIVFSTEDTKINETKVVTLKLTFNFLEKDTKLTLDGNISSIDDVGDGLKFITVSLSKENAEAFSSFMKLFQARQNNVTEFLNRTKGIA